MNGLKLDWCSHEAAEYAVKHWHYSKALPASKLVKIGVWENDRFVGCVIFSRGACRQLGTPYGLTQIQVCELTRVALTQHQAQVSRILSIAIRMLRQFCPKLRMIVSYADTEHDHHGGIYQAGNWVYCGDSTSTELYLNGVRRHRRSVGARYGTSATEKLRKLGMRATCVATKPKHRYLMPLDDEMRAQVASLSKPYPKRVGSIAGDARGVQPWQGGSSPTPTLQEAAHA